MAHHKSALKRVRQTIKRTAQKRSQRADLRTVIKKFRLILDGGNMDCLPYIDDLSGSNPCQSWTDRLLIN